MTARERLLCYIEALPLSADQRRELVLRIVEYSSSLWLPLEDRLQLTGSKGSS